ncbi:hypothetical protein [Alteromonas flava]|uniref:hypothetical protein n=1 Tax=Alteromonas flava TaxID=2048003 RepID=UPI000F5D906D|nr:hypothetical protein [Alteromonas flava]
MISNSRRNGFYIGVVFGFFGYLIQVTYSEDVSANNIAPVLFESFAFSLFSGVLFGLGTSALSGRGHADMANADDEPFKRVQTSEKVVDNDGKET